MPKRRRSGRSKVTRKAVTRTAETTRVAALEERHRKGYKARPQRADEFTPWVEIQTWPEA